MTIQADTPAPPDSAAPAGLTPEALGALLCSRICHDLISSVGAIGNGVELLREMGAAGGEELELIARSAGMASATLQFLRIAFGAAPPGDAMSCAAVQRAARDWCAFQRAELDWPPQEGETTRAAARMIFNLMQAALSALPRGGVLRVEAPPPAGGRRMVIVRAEGAQPRLPEGAAEWLSCAAAPCAPGPREVHFLAAGLHARTLDAPITISGSDTTLQLRADLPADI